MPELYANIVLPLAQPAFTFAVEGDLAQTLREGMAVAVPLGKRKIYTGIVWRLHHEKPAYSTVKPVMHAIYPDPIISPVQMRMWEWIADYYMCRIGEVMRAAMPSGMKPSGFDDEEFSRDTFRPTTVRTIRLAQSIRDEEALHRCFEQLSRRAHKQYDTLLAIVDRLANENGGGLGGEVTWNELKGDPAILKALHTKGLIEFGEREAGTAAGGYIPAGLPQLTDIQTEALASIHTLMTDHDAVLLHGVTGSGKTEIYIHLISEALGKGGDAVMLVPEIALTSQLISRLRRYFGDRVTAYHSRLTDRRRSEVYLDLLRHKTARLIVGTRSALLLPLNNPRVIIVDEEHDASYKQSDPAPRYNARDCAIIAARMYGCRVLLGSATPSIESYVNARRGKYGYVSVDRRYGDIEMPRIIVSDTLRAAKRGERHSHFNKALIDRIEAMLKNGEQTMLFQNRRGFAPYVECTECGRVLECPDCSVSLTYHKHDNKLHCHYCGYTMPMPPLCPSCRTACLTLQGFGTEKIEESLQELFPTARIGRLDRDTATSERAYNAIIERFESSQTDILVGTQMITKGFDFSRVGLVGILNADNMLNYPDFRASERAFQLITQVAGRAGRRNGGAEVILQTAQPQNPIIRYAARYDYTGMVNNQLHERAACNYPPYVRLIDIRMRHADPVLLREAAQTLGASLRTIFGNRVSGPMAPPVERIKRVHILSFLLKIENRLSFSKARTELQHCIDAIHARKEWSTIFIYCDVDPQ